MGLEGDLSFVLLLKFHSFHRIFSSLHVSGERESHALLVLYAVQG